MKNIFLLLLSFCMIAASFGQKKLIPVTHSSLTGLQLPSGSKQDSRLFSIASAKMLLEIEGKRANVSLSATEVLLLPGSADNGFNRDSLLKNLSNLGWAVSPLTGDKKYAWLQKENHQLLLYFSGDAKETGLYFAKASSTTQPNSNQRPTAGAIRTSTTTNPPPIQQNEPVTNSGFAFTTTNFDDDWKSTVQEDWVLTDKGNLKVLIHYPNAKADSYNSVLKEEDYTAWNVLVAPRYSNMKNFEWRSVQSWESISFIEADATENSTGKTVHIVLFKKHYSNGSGAYLEFITNTKADYENEFGLYHQTAFDWDKTANMQFRNKFAVAASDLSGTWTNNFTGMTQYVNAYTGASAGANTHASAQKFIFGSSNTYNWDIGVASGFVGNIKFKSAKSNGKFSVPNAWQLYFSDMEGRPKTYDAYFSCVKGSRLLWLSDIAYPGYTAFGKAK